MGGCNLSGTIPSGQTITIAGGSGIDSSTDLSGVSVANEGTLVLDSPAGYGYAEIHGEKLINSGTVRTQVEGSSLDYLEVSLEDTSTGKLEVESGELLQDEGTTTTNDAGGTITVESAGKLTVTSGSGKLVNNGTVHDEGVISMTSATWTQSGGSETGKAVALSGASLIDSEGTGEFKLSGGCKLSGTVPAGQTVTVTGGAGIDSTTTLSGGAPVTNDGTLVLDNPSGDGWAQLQGERLINSGTLRSQVEGPDLDYLEVSLENTATGVVEVKSGELRQDQGTTTTNRAKGTISVKLAGTLAVTSGSGKLVNEGSVADEGAISISSATWTQSGGSETGNAVALSGASLIDSAGGGEFKLSGGCKLSGTIPSGQTVTVSGGSGINSAATLSGGAPVTNDGTLVLDSPAGDGWAELQGEKLINSGTVRSQVESASLDYLEVNLEDTSTGKLDVKSGELRQDQGTTTANDTGGEVTVESAGKLHLTSGSGRFIDEGTIADSGTILIESASSTQSGGSETGNPVELSGATLLDSNGSGELKLVGGCKLSGQIPSGQTVTVSGGPGIDSSTTLTSNPVTNEGVLVLDSPSGDGYALIEGERLVNDGTVRTQVEGASFDDVEVNLENTTAGKLEVESGELREDQSTTTANEGTVSVDAAAKLRFTSSGAVFTNETNGTLAFELASATSFGKFELSSGGLHVSGGHISPVLAAGYNPAPASEYDVITGAYAGTFANVGGGFTADYSNVTFIALVAPTPPTVTELSPPEGGPGAMNQSAFTARASRAAKK